MSDTPIRHMLFLTVLLFIILSSGSLQCALNCYERATTQDRSNLTQTADCHPLALKNLTQSPVCNFCHNGHSPSEFEREPALESIGGGQYLAISPSRCETPEYRSAEPVQQTFTLLARNSHARLEILPLSQNLKQLRSTILLM